MFDALLTDETFHQLGIVSEASCREPWESLLGDGRVRWCPRCKSKVYRLEGLTVDEARALVRRSEPDRVCARFYRREDGALLTRGSDTLRRVGRAVRLARNVALVLFALALFGAGVLTVFGDNIRRAFAVSIDDMAPPVDVVVEPRKASRDGWTGCRFRDFDTHNAY